MEHRWGERIGVDLPVRLTAHPFVVRHGRLTNLSVSGAWIKADVELRVLSRIQVVIEMSHLARSEAPSIAGYITRSSKNGFGIEWCEFAPVVVSELLSNVTARPHVRLRRPESAAAMAVARLSSPLLKHAT